MKKLRLKYAFLLASALFAPSVSVNAGSLKIFLTAIMAFTVSSSTEFSQKGNTIDGDPYAAIQSSPSSGFTSIEGTDPFIPQNEYDNLVKDSVDAHSMLENRHIQQTVHEKMQPLSGLSNQDSAKKLAEIYDIEGLFKANTSLHNGLLGAQLNFGEPRRLQMNITEDSPSPKKKSSNFFLRGFGGGSRTKNILGFTVLMIECCILYTLLRGVLIWVGKGGDWGDNCKNCCNYYFVCNRVYNDCCRKITCGKYEGCDTFWDVPTCGLCTPCCVYFWICCNLCPESETCKIALGCERCYNKKISEKVLSKIDMPNLIKEDINTKRKEMEQARKETKQKIKEEEKKQIQEAKKRRKEPEETIKKEPRSLPELKELMDYEKKLTKDIKKLTDIWEKVNNIKEEEGKEKLHPNTERLLIKSAKKAQIELAKLALNRFEKKYNSTQNFNQKNIAPNQIELVIGSPMNNKTKTVRIFHNIGGSIHGVPPRQKNS